MKKYEYSDLMNSPHFYTEKKAQEFLAHANLEHLEIYPAIIESGFFGNVIHYYIIAENPAQNAQLHKLSSRFRHETGEENIIEIYEKGNIFKKDKIITIKI